MIEVEVKASIDNLEFVRNKILEKGAVFKKKKYQYDILLDPPEINFAKTDQVLRIRNTDGIWKLDYKSPRLDNETKSRKEYSVEISDGKKVRDIFTWMSFKLVGEIEKTRETYELNGMNIELDQVTNLGNFVEIEILSSENEFEEAKKKIFSFLESLGIKETIKSDYLELLWDKGYFKDNRK